MANDQQFALGLSENLLERARHFTGRDWVFRLLDPWLAGATAERMFLLTGEPGSGKTALAARLCQLSEGTQTPPADCPQLAQPGWLSAAHFCSARDSSSVDPRMFARSLALRLSQRYEAFAKALASTAERSISLGAQVDVSNATNSTIAGIVIENLVLSGPSAQEVFNRLIVEPLQAIYHGDFGNPIFILVDSLDEALTHRGETQIVHLLARLDGLPSAVRWLLTSRPDPRAENFTNVARLFISAPEFAAENQTDIAQFVAAQCAADARLQAKLAALPPAEAAAWPSAIARQAEGNFQYIAFLLEALAQPGRALADLSSLPTGLDALYRDSLERVTQLGRGQWPSAYAPLLGLLAVARASLTLAQLQRLTGKTEREVRDLLAEMTQFIETATTETDEFHRLYHQSVADFLASPRIRATNSLTRRVESLPNPFYLPPGEWHERLADAYPDDRLAQWDVYGLRHTITHLTEAARGNGARRNPHEQIARLAPLAARAEFQQLHRARVQDPLALQRDVQQALHVAARDDDPQAVPLVVAAALALVAFRQAELQPEPLFELARHGELAAARRRLELFDANDKWQKITALCLIWLAAETQPAEARRWRDEIKDLLPPNEPFPTLLVRLNADLDGTSLPSFFLPSAPDAATVEALVKRLGGSDIDPATSSGAAQEMLHSQTEFLGEGGYLAEWDGPYLVAYAVAFPAEGERFLQDYLTIHANYQYVEYRNESLMRLLRAVVQHPQQAWVKTMTPQLAATALAGNRLEFREGLPLTLLAARAAVGRPGAAAEWRTRRETILAELAQLGAERGQGDEWGHYKRVLATLGQAESILLGVPAAAVAASLQTALRVGHGLAGFNVPARLMLAEALSFCTPSARSDIQQSLDAALSSAHNIQDAHFCTRSTARCNALRLRWWGAPVDFRQAAERLNQSPTEAEFTALHIIGEPYQHRSQEPQKIPLPDKVRLASTLRELAENVYYLPVAELLRANQAKGWNADDKLSHGVEVNVPDVRFLPWLAARCSAGLLADQTLAAAERIRLMQALVPVAAANPTSLDTVLARLLLVAHPLLPAPLDALQQSSERYLSNHPAASSAANLTPNLPA